MPGQPRRTPPTPHLAAAAPLDGEAVEALVARHQDGVRGFLRYLGCQASLVDDLAQDTFLTLLSAQFEPMNDRATARFLRSIARHLFLKSLRRLHRDPPAMDLDAAELVWVQADDTGSSYLDALHRCLKAIQGKAKEALDLRYESGLRLAAIAERLSMTESGVHSTLVRARRRLRKCVEGRLER